MKSNKHRDDELDDIMRQMVPSIPVTYDPRGWEALSQKLNAAKEGKSIIHPGGFSLSTLLILIGTAFLSMSVFLTGDVAVYGPVKEIQSDPDTFEPVQNESTYEYNAVQDSSHIAIPEMHMPETLPISPAPTERNTEAKPDPLVKPAVIPDTLKKDDLYIFW